MLSAVEASLPPPPHWKYETQPQPTVMLGEAERRAKRSSPRSRSIPTPATFPFGDHSADFVTFITAIPPKSSDNIPVPRDRKYYCAYIMGSLSGTLYIGVSGNLHRRVFQHKFHHFEGFTDRYEVVRLLYWESYDDVHKALAREKQFKGWTRAKKIALIVRQNPHWIDQASEWYPWMAPDKAV